MPTGTAVTFDVSSPQWIPFFLEKTGYCGRGWSVVLASLSARSMGFATPTRLSYLLWAI